MWGLQSTCVLGITLILFHKTLTEKKSWVIICTAHMFCVIIKKSIPLIIKKYTPYDNVPIASCCCCCFFYLNLNLRAVTVEIKYSSEAMYNKFLICCKWQFDATVLPAKSDTDAMFCLQSYQGLRIDRSIDQFCPASQEWYWRHVWFTNLSGA